MVKRDPSSRTAALWDKASPVVGLIVPLCVAALLAEAFAPPSLKRWVITTLLNVILVVGFYVFSGVSGVISFGHIGFSAIGAYVVALLTVPTIMKGVLLPYLPSALADHSLATIPAMLIGAVSVAAFAAAVGYPIVRLKGVGPGIATLALLQVIHVVIQNWKSVTGGDSTLTGIPIDTTVPVILSWTVAVLVVAYAYQISRSGRRLRASREDTEAARSVGIEVARERYKALILSAAIMAVGGGLYGHYLGSMSPKTLYLAIGFLGVLMAVVGGINSLAGAVTGAVVVSALIEGLRRVAEGFSIGSFEMKGIPGLQEVVLAILLLVILVKMPSGLTGGREVNLKALTRLWRRPRRRAASASEQADA
jgi:branched-chain amino acid transport system permease protein